MRETSFGILPDIYFGQEIKCLDINKTKIVSYVVAGGNNGKIGIYDIVTIKKIIEWNNNSSIQSIKWSYDDKKIVSGNNDNTIKIWDSNTGYIIKVF